MSKGEECLYYLYGELSAHPFGAFFFGWVRDYLGGDLFFSLYYFFSVSSLGASPSLWRGGRVCYSGFVFIYAGFPSRDFLGSWVRFLDCPVKIRIRLWDDAYL